MKTWKLLTSIFLLGLSNCCNAAQWYEQFNLSQEFHHSQQFNAPIAIYQNTTYQEKTIVLIHGVGGSAEDFALLLPYLKNFNLVLIDLPGYGDSKTTTTNYSPKNFVNAITPILQKKLSKPFYLIGHSMGGNISLQLTEKYPHLIEKLVLIDPAGFLNKFAYGKHLAANQLQRLPFIDNQVPGAKKLIQRITDFFPDPSDVLLSGLGKEHLLENDRDAIAAISLMDENLTDQVRRITVPTLLIWGKDDIVMPYQSMYMLAYTLKNVQSLLIDSAGHSPQKEQPLLISMVIDSFLNKPFTKESPQVNVRANDITINCDKGDSISSLTNVSANNVEITDCSGSIAQLQAKKIVVRNSTLQFIGLTIQNSNDYALTAIDSQVEIWGGSLSGLVGAYLYHSELDLNGVELAGKNALVLSNQYQRISASLTVTTLNDAISTWHGLISIAL